MSKLESDNEDYDYDEDNNDSEDYEQIQPSAALALTALIDNTQDEIKPYMSSVLKNLPDEVIIGMAQTFVPNAKITVDANKPDDAVEAANLKVEEKNEKKAEALAKNPNIAPLTADKVIAGVATNVTVATSNAGSLLGVTNAPFVPPGAKVPPSVIPPGTPGVVSTVATKVKDSKIVKDTQNKIN